jgi:phosphoglycolate phosphatase-like HAD superfamily hydrolase
VNGSLASHPTAPAWATADAYLFDIDGTLLNVRDTVHYHAFHHAVAAVYGVDSQIDGVPVHGNTDVGILRAVLRRAGVSDSDFEAGLPEAIARMSAEVTANAAGIRVELCPSIPELLQRLRAAGKLLGVVSGNLEAIGWAKLERAGLRTLFAFGCFSDHNELRKNIFRHGLAETRVRLGHGCTVCLVGDTPSDILAARAVGTPVIALATGTFSLAQLKALGPDVCFSCGTDLIAGWGEV